MKPVLNELEAEGVKINRRDTDDEIAVAREKRIGGVPTMIILKDGKEVGRMVGAKNKATILYELARHS
jgi:thioredoxin 1